jgi:hypothetical protein
MFRTEHNVETSEIKEIPLTNAEIVELESLQQLALTKTLATETENRLKETAKAALLAKLGITAKEAKLLLG